MCTARARARARCYSPTYYPSTYSPYTYTYSPRSDGAILRHPAARRWRVIALTNNFSKTGDDDAGLVGAGPPPALRARFPAFVSPEAELAFLGWQDGAVPPRVRALFDDFCDSSTLGMRCALLTAWGFMLLCWRVHSY